MTTTSELKMDRYQLINARARILTYYDMTPDERALKNEKSAFERAKKRWINVTEQALDEVAAMTFEQWLMTKKEFKARAPDECFECGQKYRRISK